MAAQVLLCAALVWLYPLGAGLLKPRHTWAMQTDANGFSLLLHVAIYAGLLLCWWLQLRWLSFWSAQWVWLSWLLCSLVLLFSFPGESADVFDYLFRGRMLVEYGYSPLNTTPYQLHDFPFHRYVSWSEWVDAYGPIWEYASAGIAWVVRTVATTADLGVTNNQVCSIQPTLCIYLIKYVSAYRLCAIALTGACAWLIGRLVPNEHKATAWATFLLNPLTLIATAVGAHNEPLLIIFILLALHAFKRTQYGSGLLLLVLAAHVKITGLLVLPVCAIWLIHRVGWRHTLTLLLGVCVIGLALSWVLYAPLGGWATLPRNLSERALLSTNSWGELLYLALREGWGWTRFTAQQVVAKAAPLAFVVLSVPALLLWLRRTAIELSTLAKRLGMVVLLYLWVGSYWFQPWYVLWPLALLCVVPGQVWAKRIAVPFGVAALVSTVTTDYLRNATLPSVNGWLISLLAVMIIIVPVFVQIIRQQHDSLTRL